QQAEAKGSGPAGFGALIGRLDDGDLVLAERPGEDAARTGNPRGPFAKAGANLLCQGQPVIEEPRRAGQEAVAVSAVVAVDGLFDGDVGHGAIVAGGGRRRPQRRPRVSNCRGMTGEGNMADGFLWRPPMTEAARELLTRFDALSSAEQQQVAAEILRRATPS